MDRPPVVRQGVSACTRKSKNSAAAPDQHINKKPHAWELSTWTDVYACSNPPAPPAPFEASRYAAIARDRSALFPAVRISR